MYRSRQVETIVFFFQAEDGIRDLVRSRGLGDVYKRQRNACSAGIGLREARDDAIPGVDLEIEIALGR